MSDSTALGEDWLLAAASLVASAHAAEGPFAGCLLSRAVELLNIPAPTPSGAERMASLAARSYGLLQVVNVLAARAQERQEGAGTVTLAPVLVEEGSPEAAAAKSTGAKSIGQDGALACAYQPADEPLRLRQVVKRGAPTGDWELAWPETSVRHDGEGRGPEADAAPDHSIARPLEAWIASLDADDVFLHLDLDIALAHDEAGDEIELAQVPAPGLDALMAGESWLLPVPGEAVWRGARPRELVASPPAERTVQVRGYGAPSVPDAVLDLVDAVREAAADHRGLGLYSRRRGKTASWTCVLVSDGSTHREAKVWPQRVAPRPFNGSWLLVALTAAGDVCVINLMTDAMAACETSSLPASQDHAPNPALPLEAIDVWGLPASQDHAPSPSLPLEAIDVWGLPDAFDAPALTGEVTLANDVLVVPKGVTLRATEVRRADGGPGNVMNKLALLAERGWREEVLGGDAAAPASRAEDSRAGDAATSGSHGGGATSSAPETLWRSPAPLTLVGFSAFWRFVQRFGASLLVEGPAPLRELHREAAWQRVLRFSERAPRTPERQVTPPQTSRDEER